MQLGVDGGVRVGRGHDQDSTMHHRLRNRHPPAGQRPERRT